MEQAVHSQQPNKQMGNSICAGAHPQGSNGAGTGAAQDAARHEALAIITARLADPRHIAAEYKHILQLDERIKHNVDDSQQPANSVRNRYINVLPYDYNRVKAGSSLPYINASHVRLPDRISDHEFRYIATQGPLPSTAADFWRMVLVLQAPSVIMLTGIMERGQVKCAPYFPQAQGEVMDLGNGLGSGLTVTCTASGPQAGGQLTVRTLVVSDASRTPLLSHTLTHYQFNAWPDHGAPRDGCAIGAICRALQASRQAGATALAPAGAADGAAGGPEALDAVVHCSAGIGRTGTFMAIDVMLERLRALAGGAGDSKGAGASSRQVHVALDVATLVHELRQQRMNSVQTYEQYFFIYQALRDELAAELGVAADGSSNSNSS